MESTRQHKYGRQIQKDIALVFQKDPKHFFGNNLVTVTGVDVAIDLSLVKVFFSVLPYEKAEEAIEKLNQLKSEIRGQLGKIIGKRTRAVPELAFFIDDTEEKAQHIDKLFDKLDIPEDSENDSAS